MQEAREELNELSCVLESFKSNVVAVFPDEKVDFKLRHNQVARNNAFTEKFKKMKEKMDWRVSLGLCMCFVLACYVCFEKAFNWNFLILNVLIDIGIGLAVALVLWVMYKYD